jgi:N-acetylneuraminate synthase
MFNKEIIINGTTISFSNPTYFIADIAANHDGNLDRARHLIFLAKQAGANAVKFQHHNVAKYVSDFGFKSLNGKFSHQKNWDKSIFEVYQDAQVPTGWTNSLKEYCDEIAIDFFSTPYDLDMIDHLRPFVCAFKIGSGDINNDAMLIKTAKTGLPVLFACGASTMDEVIHAVDILCKETMQIILLQCNTNYTADKDNFNYVNLNVIRTLQQKFPGLILGLSDHTSGHATVLGAVALGARVIEKHFTDDITRKGPDHKFSMDFETWQDMVLRTRELELALGDGIKRVEENEKETVILQRRAIRAVKDLTIGDQISRENIEFQRPAPKDAFSPNDFKNLDRKLIVKDVQAGDYIRKEHLKC